MAKGIRRRQAMLALGALGTGSVLSASRVLSGAFDGLLSAPDAEAASCILTLEQTEGPCYIDDELRRAARATRTTRRTGSTATAARPRCSRSRRARAAGRGA